MQKIKLKKYKNMAIRLGTRLRKSNALHGISDYVVNYNGNTYRCKVLNFNHDGSNSVWQVQIKQGGKKINLLRNKQDIIFNPKKNKA